MRAKRRKFTAAFKAELAIEALKERESMAELSKRFEIHPNMITTWKREFWNDQLRSLITPSPKWVLTKNDMN